MSPVTLASTDPQHNHNSDNDIDLLNVLRSIFRTWKLWLISIIVVSTIFLGIQALKAFIHSPIETVYSKPIRLTFPNAHKQVFPSGAKFNYSDIVAPAVVQQAFDRNKLESFELTIADLQGGLSATPYAPTYPLIIERYNRLLTDKKLTPDHIADLKKQMEKELEQATTGEVLISWRLSEQSIPKSIAAKVLNDIPAIWAEQAIKEKGVLEINANLTTASSMNPGLILNEEILVAGDILLEKLSLLKSNIGELRSFEGSQTITDPQTGMRLVDLANAIDDIKKYGIRNFTAPIRTHGLTSTPELTSYYYLDKLNSLKIKLVSLQSQAASIKESLSSYNKSDGASSLINSDTNNSPALMAQLSSDMLDKLVSLSSDADREKYKQKLNTEWLDFTKEIATTQSQITETELILNAISKNLSQSAKMNAEYAQYLKLAKAKLPEILQQITDYFAVSERIAKQLRNETVGIKEQLYIPVTDTIIEDADSFDLKGTIIAWLALMVLTTILVVPGLMIRNALKGKTQ